MRSFVRKGIGCIQQLLRQHIGWFCIKLDVARFVVNHQFAAEIERFQHGAAQAGFRPIPICAFLQIQIPAGKRPAHLDLPQHTLCGLFHLLPAARLVLLPELPFAGKAGPVLRRQDG